MGLVEGAGGVQGDDFGAEQVVAGGDVEWDFDVDWWEGGTYISMLSRDTWKICRQDWFSLERTAATAVLHVFDAPPVVVAL